MHVPGLQYVRLRFLDFEPSINLEQTITGIFATSVGRPLLTLELDEMLVKRLGPIIGLVLSLSPSTSVLSSKKG